MSNAVGEIASIFLNFRDNVKVYHWQTHSYSRHKASDKLVDRMSDKMDKFVEVMQGSRNERVKMPTQNVHLDNQNDDTIVELLKNFRVWLNRVLPQYLQQHETDLFNIRDEILADVNQALYLFTLK